jgi:hypothetical protein
VVRAYKVEDEKGKTLAEEVAVMEYKAPGTKTFTTTSANGSAFIRGHVFMQLMKREAGREREPVRIETALLHPITMILKRSGRNELAALTAP